MEKKAVYHTSDFKVTSPEWLRFQMHGFVIIKEKIYLFKPLFNK